KTLTTALLRASRGRRRVWPRRPSAVGIVEAARALLFALLPLAIDIPFPLLAAEFGRALSLELIAVNLQRVLDVDALLHARQLPYGGECQCIVLELQVLELLVFLVRPAHRPGEVLPILLDLQSRCPLLFADFILTLPCPDRVDRFGLVV